MNKTEPIAALAQKLSNDIAEGIDCGESKKELRLAIAWWADQFTKERRDRIEAQDQLITNSFKRTVFKNHK